MAGSSFPSTPNGSSPPLPSSLPSDGPSEHVRPSTNGHTASLPSRVLLLLDVQVAPLSDPPLGVPAARKVGPNIAKVLSAARTCPPASRPRIIHVRNAGAPGELDEPYSPGWVLVHTPLPDEPVLDKRKNNAFAGTALAELVPLDAELVVVGLQSDFCVRATCSTALGRGNEVVLIRGAHATYDRLEIWDGRTNTPAERVESEIEDELEEAGVIILEMKDLPHIFSDR